MGVKRMKYAIITGASKGLGASIAERFIQEGIQVIGVSRTENRELSELSSESETKYQHFKCNLSNMDELERTFEKIKDQIFKESTELVYLINNAATVNPIDIATKHTTEAVEAHIKLNLTAPIITTALVLKRAKESGVKTIITNITSGAADRSTYGWSAYGASKAGLNHYTNTVALEQNVLKTNNKVILFDPSIMDTNMQGDIRKSNPASFQEVEKFRKYKEENQLSDTRTVANVLVDILLDAEMVENGKYYSIKDY